MMRRQPKGEVNIVKPTYVVWDIVSGKNIRSGTCSASETNSEPYVNSNIGDPI